MMTTTTPDPTFALGDLVRLLRHRGIAAEIEMTGGGVATVYAALSANVLASSAFRVVPVVTVGPGDYDWNNPERSQASLEELSATQHPTGYGSEGETADFGPGWALADVADRIVRLVRDLPEEPGA
jgi:hypothetical protein